MKVYFVIVTYNGAKWIKKCLESIFDADTPVDVFVIDNGSNDGTQEIIKKNFPKVDLIQSERNLGFGAANNIGIAAALEQGAKYIFLLNQDTYFFKCSLKSLISQINSDKKIGVISPIHLAGDEKNLDFFFAKCLRPENTPAILGDFFKNEIGELYESQFVNAAAWFVKADVFRKWGGFHPVFEHYGEDDEFIMRITKNGLRLFISSQNIIVHDTPQVQSTNPFFRIDRALLRKYLLKDIKEDFKSDQIGAFRRAIFRQAVKGNLKTCKKLAGALRIYKKKRIVYQKNQIPLLKDLVAST